MSENKDSGLGSSILAGIVFFLLFGLVLFVASRSCDSVNASWADTAEEVSDTAVQKIEIIKIMLISVAGILGILTIISFLIRGMWGLRRITASKKEVAMFTRNRR